MSKANAKVKADWANRLQNTFKRFYADGYRDGCKDTKHMFMSHLSKCPPEMSFEEFCKLIESEEEQVG